MLYSNEKKKLCVVIHSYELYEFDTQFILLQKISTQLNKLLFNYDPYFVHCV